MVTTAPRVRPPPTDGATTSPTSASLRRTVPVNGARMTVFSLLAWARRSPASARAPPPPPPRARGGGGVAARGAAPPPQGGGVGGGGPVSAGWPPPPPF